MQPYRLEMGTRLETAHGSNLYQFWGSRIAEHLNQRAARQPAGERVIVNLASQEYFKSVDLKHLKPPVVECAFEDYKNGAYKIISFHAKRARGLMARFAIQRRARSAAELEAFDLEGYALAPASSTPARLCSVARPLTEPRRPPAGPGLDAFGVHSLRQGPHCTP